MAACGLTPSDVQDMIAAYRLSFAEKVNATVAAGGFVFDQYLSPPPANASAAPAACAPQLRQLCGPHSPSQASALLLQFTRNNHTTPWPLPYPQQDLAAFLLARGPHALLGYAWAGCKAPSTYQRPAGLDVDYGQPLNFCTEVAPGVFARNYSKANVAMDCNSFEASIDMV